MPSIIMDRSICALPWVFCRKVCIDFSFSFFSEDMTANKLVSLISSDNIHVP
jgi:hypothetical protein